MSDYVLMLNAGSSSLKFGLYAKPEDGDWRLEARGQIEGIGTSSRMRAASAKAKSLSTKILVTRRAIAAGRWKFSRHG